MKGLPQCCGDVEHVCAFDAHGFEEFFTCSILKQENKMRSGWWQTLVLRRGIVGVDCDNLIYAKRSNFLIAEATLGGDYLAILDSKPDTVCQLRKIQQPHEERDKQYPCCRQGNRSGLDTRAMRCKGDTPNERSQQRDTG